MQPDVIVIAQMSRRLYPADDAAVKEAFTTRSGDKKHSGGQE